MVNFIEFKNKLIMQEIMLFDHDYRLLLNNMNILDNDLNQNNHVNKNQQIGGASYYESPFFILDKSYTNKKQRTKEDPSSKKSDTQCEQNLEININSIDSSIYKIKLSKIIDNLVHNKFDKAKYICSKKFIPKIV